MFCRGLRNRSGGPVTVNGLATMLKNPFYIGLMQILKTSQTFKGTHEPLISTTLFENAPVIEAGQRTLFFPSEADDRETLDRLSEMGFRRPLETSALVRRWATGSYGTLKGAFARSQLAEIVPMLLQHFARSANPDAAVAAFDRFLAGLHGGGRLFSLLRQNPDRIALIALVLGTAPRLADGVRLRILLIRHLPGYGRGASLEEICKAGECPVAACPIRSPGVLAMPDS